MADDPKKTLKERYEAAKQKGDHYFYPHVIYSDLIVSFGIFILLVGLATFVGVANEPPADPSDATYIPRPEWYFLWLFEMLKYFPGTIEWVGTTVVPIVLVLLLLLRRAAYLAAVPVARPRGSSVVRRWMKPASSLPSILRKPRPFSRIHSGSPSSIR